MDNNLSLLDIHRLVFVHSDFDVYILQYLLSISIMKHLQITTFCMAMEL